MAELDIPRELVERLRRIAEREQRPVDDLVRDLDDVLKAHDYLSLTE